jgi:DNA-binding phage protein
MTGKAKATTRSHEQATIESFRKNPKLAAEYLNAVLQECNQAELSQKRRAILEGIVCGEMAVAEGRTVSHADAKKRMARRRK